MTETEIKPIVEALIYLAEEPITEATLVGLFGKEHQEPVRQVLARLVEQYQAPDCGLEIKQIANGFKMATKAEHHDWVRKYVKHQTPPTKLSLAALETLAVIAYKQPITVPEIQEIRGVNAVGVLKTLLDKKLISTAGRKNVIGRPILYRTTKEFLVHFGLKNLDELPSLEEFESLARSAAGAIAEQNSDPDASEVIQGEIIQESLPLESNVEAERVEAATIGIVSVESASQKESAVDVSSQESGTDSAESVFDLAQAPQHGVEPPQAGGTGAEPGLAPTATAEAAPAANDEKEKSWVAKPE